MCSQRDWLLLRLHRQTDLGISGPKCPLPPLAGLSGRRPLGQGLPPYPGMYLVIKHHLQHYANADVTEPNSFV